MSRPGSANAIAWTVFAIAVALSIAGEVLAVLNLSAPNASDWGSNWGHIASGAAFFTFSVVGIVIASRRPGHPVAWICLGIGLCTAVDALASGYGTYALVTNPGSLPEGELMSWVESWIWVVFTLLVGIVLLLLFPDGRLLSRRWRAVAWLGVIATAAAVASNAFKPGLLEEEGDTVNPLGIEGAEGVLDALNVGIVLLLACLLASAASVVLRFRRSSGDERLQLKWFASAAAFAALSFLAAFAGGDLAPQGVAEPAQDVSQLAVATLPIAVGVAILKYRLYGIDVVINKAVVVTAMAVFITAVYVGIVVGLGAAIGRAGDPNVALSILATTVVAVAFQPVRERAQRFANRLVYGKRATPYEVLAEFSDRVAATPATDEVLPNMARTIAEGTGAERAGVWLRAGGELRLAASWPADASDCEQRLPLSNGQVPSFSTVDRAVAVRHRDELLGALTVVKPTGEPLSPTEDKLLTDLASQAAVVLRNVGLTSELVARLEELAASRQRLVAAQDEARRRLERNLHDGAQQHLVALKVRLNLAARLAGDQPRLKEALESLQASTDEAIEALRDLARGIYPPLLAEEGLEVALKGQVRKVAIPVEVRAAQLSRYSQDVEAAVYFCCLEALQNVTKYADDAEVVVSISDEGGRLRFSIEDNGAGFDPESQPRGSGLQNMADRMAALGGRLEVHSAVGKGTSVSGDLPAQAVLTARLQ